MEGTNLKRGVRWRLNSWYRSAILLIGIIVIAQLCFIIHMLSQQSNPADCDQYKKLIQQIAPEAGNSQTDGMLPSQGASEVKPSSRSYRGPIVIYYHGGVSRWLGPHMLGVPPKCDQPCIFTEEGNMSRADAVVFHIPSFTDAFPEKHSEQIWVAMSMESSAQEPRLKVSKFMDRFDLKMTYELDSDVVASYWNSNLSHYMAPVTHKSDLAMFTASNCHPKSGRMEYVTELMKYIQVDSYGKCLHNKDFEELKGNDKGKQKLETLRKYKFSLAFENSISHDYVSEKFFQALAAGSVPVYMGADNIDEFSPSNHSVIKTSDFKSPKELAEYLQYLDQNDEDYQKYLSWKIDGPQQSFLNLLDIAKVDARCRLCKLIAYMKM